MYRKHKGKIHKDTEKRTPIRTPEGITDEYRVCIDLRVNLTLIPNNFGLFKFSLLHAKGRGTGERNRSGLGVT